MFKLATHTSMM